MERRSLPLRKEQLYFWMASLGAVIALVSSLLDHLRTGFENPWLWVPALSGVFSVAVAAMLALLDSPERADLIVYFLAMGLLLVVGPLGFVLHLLRNLGPGGTIVVERLLRGAPVLAPMVFANMGLLGMLVLLDPHPARRETK